MTVVSVGRDQGIVLAGGRDATHRNGLLANVNVAKSTDLLVLVGLHGPDLELADQVHVTQPAKQGLGGQ